VALETINLETIKLETIKLETVDSVAWLSFNRPPLNGMIPRMVLETYEVLQRVAVDPAIRVVVITGSGGPGNGFLPGADLRYMLTPQRESDRVNIESDPRYAISYRVGALLHEMPQVSIAAINGAVAGAGLGWALGCDFRVAAVGARFNTAFLSLGVAGDMGLPWALPRLVGAAKARELCFLPAKFDAHHALALGLVSDVYDNETWEENVQRFIQRLLDYDAAALRTLKANFVSAERMSYGDYIDLETSRHFPLVRGEQAREGFKKFFE
jgi:2-(1,2-epoxy-1,2-dihydrophenyl)acetyl-CoA isomerase